MQDLPEKHFGEWSFLNKYYYYYYALGQRLSQRVGGVRLLNYGELRRMYTYAAIQNFDIKIWSFISTVMLQMMRESERHTIYIYI